MVSERNRKLRNYLESLGITVNIGKTKARGNKGFFRGNSTGNFRIDIAANLTEEDITSVLTHEFAHYLHYTYDNTLKNLDFIFGKVDNSVREELIKVTVNEIPKDFATELIKQKEELSAQIKFCTKIIKSHYPNFLISTPFKTIERSIKWPAKYLLKYDRIRFFNRTYSVKTIENDFGYLSQVQSTYIILKSKQRAIKRINAKISRLNKYYNCEAELFARFISLYFLKPHSALNLAPLTSKLLSNIIEKGDFPELTEFSKLFK